jgi:hypothetical protein
VTGILHGSASGYTFRSLELLAQRRFWSSRHHKLWLLTAAVDVFLQVVE